MSVQLLGAFHCISELLAASAKRTQELFTATCNYLNGTSNEWYFFTDRDPLPAISYRITKQASFNRIQWTYNTYQNTLVQNCSGLQPVAVRCNWLSVELHVGRRVWTLDDWIRSLYIVVENRELLTLEVLVNAWSIHERVWPDTYELHVVDDEGELHIFHKDDLLDEEWQSLLPRAEGPPEPYVESEDDEQEEETEPEAEAEPIVESVEPVTPAEPIVEPVEPVTPAEPTVTPLPLPPSPPQEVEVT